MPFYTEEATQKVSKKLDSVFNRYNKTSNYATKWMSCLTKIYEQRQVHYEARVKLIITTNYIKKIELWIAMDSLYEKEANII